MSSNFNQIGPPTTELAALERLRNTSLDLIMGKMVFPLFLCCFWSFWYFHVTRTSIKAWMSLNFLKWDLTLAHWTQVSDRCPLGYLFNYLDYFNACVESHLSIKALKEQFVCIQALNLPIGSQWWPSVLITIHAGYQWMNFKYTIEALPCFPEINYFVPLNPKIKSWFPMFPILQNCLCSGLPLIFRPLFPCSPEINTFVPQNPWEGLTIVFATGLLRDSTRGLGEQ